MAKDLIIFKDFYNYYNAIKYEFEYGLPYDKEIAVHLFQKELQSKKLTTDILGSIKNNIDQIPYYNLLKMDKKGAKFKCSLFNKNRYNFFSNNWFDYIYSSYGYVATSKEREVKFKEKMYDKIQRCNKNSKDEENDNNFTVKIDRESQIESKMQDLINGFMEYIYILTKQEENIVDTEKNSPSENFLKSSKLLNNESSNIIYKEFYKDEEFYDMIDFFSRFSFLGSLGASLKRKMDLNNYIGTRIFIRGISSFYGLTQESIYRCLYAIWGKREILIKLYGSNKSVKGIPLKVFYKGHTLHEEDAYPYVEILRSDVDKLEIQYESYSLHEGNRITLEDEYEFKQNEKDINKKYTRINVEFYYNDNKENGEITEYILNRIESHIWEKEFDNKNSEELEMALTKEFQSIYYPINYKWKVKKSVYRISEEDYTIFIRWIKSFGEFAEIIKEEPKILIVKEDCKKNMNIKKVRNGNKIEDIEYSLFNPYNSEILKKMVEQYNELAEIKCILYPLPQEIFWLEYILKYFPNIYQIFFENKKLKVPKIGAYVSQDANRLRNVFNPFKNEKGLLMHNGMDIKKDSIQKYSVIWKNIKNQQLLQYSYMNKEENKEEEKRVFLYAFEYNVVTAHSLKKNEPFLIMAYDMNQKRTVNLDLKINMLGASNVDNMTFFDKLYCVIAFNIRVNNAKSEFKNNNIYLNLKNEKILETEYKNGNDDMKKEIENRLGIIRVLDEFVKSAIFKYKGGDFVELYETRFCDKNSMNFMSENMKKVFSFYYDYFKKEENSKSKYTIDMEQHGVTICGEEEKWYKFEILSAFCNLIDKYKDGEWNPIIERINKIDNSIIKEILLGNPYQFLYVVDEKINLEIEGNKLNEIVYINEKMKLAKFTFKLKKNNITVKNMDRIYNVFREFNCIGEKIKEKEAFSIQFTVFYERFNYRKIHMGILSLENLIQKIEPKELKDLINIREGGTMSDKIIKISLIEREGIKTDEVIYPKDIYDIPNLESISDLEIMEKHAEKTLKKYKNKNIMLYITSGLTVATLAVLNVAYRYEITITAMHRDMNNGQYVEQNLSMDYSKSELQEKICEDLKVCIGRHVGVPGKEIFEVIPSGKIMDMDWLQNNADYFLKDFKEKSVRLYITGLTQAVFAILNAANKFNVSITAMHFNTMTDEYFDQEIYSEK